MLDERSVATAAIAAPRVVLDSDVRAAASSTASGRSSRREPYETASAQFVMPGQALRKKSVRQKLNPIGIEFKDKVVLLVDDSIVRGTTSRKIVQMMRDAGAKEVHFRISSPPITHPDYYGIDTPERAAAVAKMLAVSQALIPDPKLLLIDEPTEGLMPAFVETISRTILDFVMEKKEGVLTSASTSPARRIRPSSFVVIEYPRSSTDSGDRESSFAARNPRLFAFASRGFQTKLEVVNDRHQPLQQGSVRVFSRRTAESDPLLF